MNRTTLGRTDISVSTYCLGTMTFGTQTSEADSHTQIEIALDAGIDFLDTAEMYPVNPIKAETVGRTEKIIGNWNAKSGRRAECVIATKHSGQGGFVRPGQPITKDTIQETLNGSLRRLQTDYVDLYQLHWPNRGSYHFRQNWGFDPSKQPADAAIFDEMCGILEKLKEMETAGKIRAFGLSNESAWGTMKWLEAARATGGPRVAAMQNEYSLLCRLYDTDMGETAYHEDITLLAFSPLACGYLTGKYQGGVVPEGSRKSIGKELGGRASPRVEAATDAYIEIAQKYEVDPTHMALAWTLTRPFPTIPIFGATTCDQLRHIVDGLDINLTKELLADVNKAHRAHPMPY
jgi:aryl-alcohol dehydrogenase-like predicted oxidoreductase